MTPENFRSKNLNLPFIAPAQAQKHVTVNETFRALDALVQLSVLARDMTDPPANPTKGARYLVPSGATGAWAGKDGYIAAWQDGAWAYYAPQSGWRLWCEADGALLAYDGSSWTLIAGAGAHENLPGLGIGTAPDTVNRLAVVSPAALLPMPGMISGLSSIRRPQRIPRPCSINQTMADARKWAWPEMMTFASK